MDVTANLNVTDVRPIPMDCELVQRVHIIEATAKTSVVGGAQTAGNTECANARVIAVRTR